MTATKQTHPVIVYTLERKWAQSAFFAHTLVLTDPSFYEAIDDYDWAGADFQIGIKHSANGSLPDGPGLWTAEFRVTDDKELGDNDVFQLVQESPWRPLNDKEAVLFAQGLPIEEVIAARPTVPPDTTVCVTYRYWCGRCNNRIDDCRRTEPPIDFTTAPGAKCSQCGQMAEHIATQSEGQMWTLLEPRFNRIPHQETTDE